MEREFRNLSNNVILSKDNNGKELYFTSADSAASFNKVFVGDDSLYSLSVSDIEITLGDGVSTDAVLMTYCKEDDTATRAYFIEVIVCTILGTFISDWY